MRRFLSCLALVVIIPFSFSISAHTATPGAVVLSALTLIHRKIEGSGGRDRSSIREKCLPVRENGGCDTNPCPLRKALFRCAHLRTARTGFW